MGFHRFPFVALAGVIGLSIAHFTACGDRPAPVDPPRLLSSSAAAPEQASSVPQEPPEPPDASVGAREPDASLAAPQATVESGLPMLLDFTRDHCLPCEIMAPWVDELRKKHAGRVLVKEINIDRNENKELGRFFKTRSIPTQVYVDGAGREVSRHVGLATQAQMELTIEKLGFVPKR